MSTMDIWYIARGAGLAALVLLTISTCIGALMTGRGRAHDRVAWHYVHRVTASTGLTALLVHVGAILADSYAHVGWVGSIIPFTSGFRPTWIGMGTLAIYTFVFAAAIGFARGRFAASERGARIWRWLHGLAYVGWFMAALHGLKSGSDTSVIWVQTIYISCALAVTGAIVARAAAVQPRFAARVPARARALVGQR